MVLDYRSVSVALGICFFLFAGGLFVFQARQTRKDGMNEWIIGQVLIGLFSILFSLRGVIPDFLSILVANTCLTASYSVAYVAVMKFHHRLYRRELFIFPVAATFLVFLFFRVYTDNTFVRSLYITLVSGMQAGFIASILLRDASPRTQRAQWFTGSVFALITLLWLGRFFELLISPAPPTRMMNLDLPWAVILLSGIGLVILINIGAPLMIWERSKEHLRESEERYRRLFEDSVMGISETAPDGRLMQVNLAYARMHGYATPEEMIAELNGSGRSPSLIPADEEEMGRILTEKKFMEPREMRLTRRDGTPLYVVMTAREMCGPDGRLLSRQATYLDITARKQAEEEKRKLEGHLRRSEKMEAIGTLAGGIAHDFNNILGAVMGYTQLAQIDLPKGSPLHDNLDQVLKASERAKDLVNQILFFSRQGEQEQRPIHILPVVKEALKLIRASLPKSIEIKQNLGIKEDTIMGDPTQIHQVIMNLCTNAAQAMPGEKGLIDIHLEEIALALEDLKAFPKLIPGPYLILIVIDTGEGIDPTILPHIFDPFFTTKESWKGTGMGLAVVHGIVKSHKGEITVYSEMGTGTTFRIYLPKINRTIVSEGKIEEALPTGKERVLFVDDEPGIVEPLVQMLKRLGYSITSRVSSLEALDAFKARPDQFDLIITDQTMPHMNGTELAQEILRIRPDIPIILCSGFSETITPEEAIAMGVRKFLTKPILISELAAVIRKVLDEAKG